MSGNEWRDDQRPRIEAWWNQLDEESRGRLLDLGEDGDVPPDLAQGLSAAGVVFVSTWREPDQSDVRSHRPSLLREFLAEQREASGR